MSSEVRYGKFFLLSQWPRNHFSPFQYVSISFQCVSKWLRLIQYFLSTILWHVKDSLDGIFLAKLSTIETSESALGFLVSTYTILILKVTIIIAKMLITLFARPKQHTIKDFHCHEYNMKRYIIQAEQWICELGILAEINGEEYFAPSFVTYHRHLWDQTFCEGLRLVKIVSGIGISSRRKVLLGALTENTLTFEKNLLA